MILPQEAEDGWKTWSKRVLPDNSTIKGDLSSYFYSYMGIAGRLGDCLCHATYSFVSAGFDNGVFQGHMQDFFRQLGEEALKKVAAKVTATLKE